MEITFNQVDVEKLNLGPDDVLVVTVKTKEANAGLNYFADSLRETFDKNKVVVIGLIGNDEVAFTIVREKPQQNYCSDCNCGKREGTENGLS